MQVGLNTTSLSGNGASGNIASVRQQSVQPTTAPGQKLPAPASDYPASPLITTRPQRYSVQLNDQLTTLQQADHYLSQLEQQLLDYRHASRRGSPAQQQKGADLAKMLEKRTTLSGGAVDRQLRPVLQGQAQVSFQSPDLVNLAQQNGAAPVMFSVTDGRQTQLAAVAASDDAQDPRQYSVMFSNALRRVGIQMHNDQDHISFSTTETQWPQIAKTLSVRSDNGSARNAGFVAVKTFAEPSQADDLLQSLQQGSAHNQGMMQQALDTIGEQRAQMAVQQEKARQLIDGMARFPQSESAIQASRTLGGVLDSANYNYQVLAQAVKGQARISSMTVRSLLD
ncbi:TPA: flagellar hook-associated protein [Citrobacter freundii]